MAGSEPKNSTPCFFYRKHDWFIATGLFLAFTALYLATSSCALDEWDSVNFALGVEHFDVSLYQPHPPGYPLYILSGKLIRTLTGVSPEHSLIWTSCLFGGIYLAMWYLFLLPSFGRVTSLLTAITTGWAAGPWMTATKALTDIPASALIAGELFMAASYQRTRKLPWMAGAALSGGLAAGMRPQYTFIIIVIFLFCLVDAKSGMKRFLFGVALMVLCLALWLVPLVWIQAHRTDPGPDWSAYPRLVVTQWQWRLDKPDVYLGADPVTPGRVVDRIRSHIGRWFSHGLGLGAQAVVGCLGLIVWLFGTGIYFLGGTYREPAQSDFWRRNLPWVLIHVLIILVALPPDVRYYCPILPLLVLLPLAGFRNLPRFTAVAGFLFPALIFSLTLPLAIQAHREPPPPVQLGVSLQSWKNTHPEAQCTIYLGDSRRQVKWYFPDLPVLASLAAGPAPVEGTLKNVIFTDDPDFLRLNPWKGWRLQPVKVFSRSDIIYRKHAEVILYRVRQEPFTH
ncbi:MAG TPA: hypothetical protein PK014_00070 [Thermoanaerobaculia bacterium]|nr:hypothetical protein [Thermoanaerobaculia bacterium]HXK69109.1 hypothetical protein [Thermoanaerobaculia bacterium]